MITAYVLRAIAIGGLIGIAASLLDFALAIGKRPRRFVWLVALALATVVPAAGIIGVDSAANSRAAESSAPTSNRLESRDASAPALFGGADRLPGPSAARSTQAVAPAAKWTLVVPPWFQGFDRPLAALWIAASLLWGAILVISAVRIHRNRRRWREAMLDGMPVYTSHDVGPALFGLTRFGIVVPMWVTELEPEHRRLIVTHEREHARAADPVTLLAGALLVLIQPLNPAVWAIFRRLRLAIEIDCDARVLVQAGDVRTYGDLLIDVGERTLTGAAPIAALSEGGAELERRIDAMSRQDVRWPSLRVLGGLGASVMLGIAAWKVPTLAAGSAQRPATVQGNTVREQTGRERAIVSIHSVGLHNARNPQVLIWAVGGPVDFAIDGGELRPLTDTVRLDRLPAMRFDVTEGSAVVRLMGGGSMSLAGDIEAGPARRFSAEASQVTFIRGGIGVAYGDSISAEGVELGALRTVTDVVLRRLVGERFPGMLEGAPGAEPYVWLLVDGQDRLIGSNRGLGDLPRAPDGRLGSLRSSGVRSMLPGMAPRLRKGEAWGWSRLPTASGDTLNVIWVRQLYDAAGGGLR